MLNNMNRQIKFRAWHNTKKVMLYPPLPTDSMTSIRRNSPNGPHWKYDGIPHRAQMMWDGRMYIEGEYQDVTWMQYTGLKDSKGRELYEGDFLSIENENFLVVEWQADLAQFQQRNLQTDETLDLTIFSDCYVIVGNIFEDPELLKK